MSKDGWIRKDQEKALAKIIDDAIQFNGLIELIDGYVAKAAITLIDDSLLEKVPIKEEIKALIGQLVDAAIAENVDLANEIASDILNSLIDIPGIDEDSETVLFDGAVKIVVGSVLGWIKRKQKE